MKRFLIAAMFIVPSAASAQRANQATPPPEVATLSQMVQEAQGREAAALVRAYTAEAQVQQLREKVAAAKEAEEAKKTNKAPEADPVHGPVDTVPQK